MSPYCHNPPLDTTPNAKIRTRIPYAAPPCGFVAKIACKDVEKCGPRDFGPVFRLFWA
jgi:hypothetical protein